MSLNDYTTRAMANERHRDFERDAAHSRLARDARSAHASLVSRMRERMPFVRPRDRRSFRPARAES